MKTKKGTIQRFMETKYPNHFASGRWACCLITYMEQRNLCVPNHAFKVSVGDKKQYWVWLDHD